MTVKFFFAWYDFWVGFFYDKKKRVLYICPLPCCVFMFQGKQEHDFLVVNEAMKGSKYEQTFSYRDYRETKK